MSGNFHMADACSARQAFDIEELQRKQNETELMKDNLKIQKQNEPILNELHRLTDVEKEQNKKLQDQIDELKKANEGSINDAEEAKSEAKKPRRFGRISFGISTFIAVASLVVAIITMCI